MATITVTELALTLDTDSRTARKFLRAVTPADEQPGKGGRWAIEKRAIRSLTKQFTAWDAERTPAPAAPADDAPAAADDEITLDADPTDDELLAIDSE